MKEFKLIATDMDGTLLNDVSLVDKKDYETLQRLNKKGINTVLVTGRILSMVEVYYKTMPFIKYVISANGASIDDVHNNLTIAQNFIDLNLINKILDYTSENKIECNLLSREVCYFPKNSVRIKRFERYNEIAKANNYKEMKLLRFNELEAIENIEKILIYTKDQEKITKILNFLNELDVTLTQSDFGLIEVSSKGITKGYGLRKLREHLNLEKENIIAFGDFYNDESLFLESGFRVAMGNAVPKLKEKADFITKTNAEQGISYILNKMEENNEI